MPPAATEIYSHLHQSFRHWLSSIIAAACKPPGVAVVFDVSYVFYFRSHYGRRYTADDFMIERSAYTFLQLARFIAGADVSSHGRLCRFTSMIELRFRQYEASHFIFHMAVTLEKIRYCAGRTAINIFIYVFVSLYSAPKLTKIHDIKQAGAAARAYADDVNLCT